MNWIKCSERLPERLIRVLVWMKDGFDTAGCVINGNRKYSLWYLNSYKEKGLYDGPGWELDYQIDHNDAFVPMNEVTHWMPLPKPPGDQ